MAVMTWSWIMDDPIHLPCGCVMGTVETTFVVYSCPKGESCEWVQYTTSVAEEQGKPGTILEMP